MRRCGILAFISPAIMMSGKKESMPGGCLREDSPGFSVNQYPPHQYSSGGELPALEFQFQPLCQ